MMTTYSGSRGLHLASGPRATLLADTRCGDCPACCSGRDYWCLSELSEGPVLGEIQGVTDVDLVRRWTSAMLGLASAPRHPGSVLLVLADVPLDRIATLVAPWHDGPVLAGTDTRDPGLRGRLAELSPTGRAPLVLAVGDVRAAVRAVQRGGQVCGPDAPVRLPSITELVQRDVTLVSARGIDALADRQDWAALAEQLGIVLRATSGTGVTL